MNSTTASEARLLRAGTVADGAIALRQKREEHGDNRRGLFGLWVIDGTAKEMVWKRMLRQAVNWPGIDLILCTLLIWPCHSEIEKPKWMWGCVHSPEHTTLISPQWTQNWAETLDEIERGGTSQDTGQDSCFRPANKQLNPLEGLIYWFIAGLKKSQSSCNWILCILWISTRVSAEIPLAQQPSSGLRRLLSNEYCNCCHMKQEWLSAWRMSVWRVFIDPNK